MKISAALATILPISLLLAGSLQAQTTTTLTVSAHMDIWQSGGYIDGSDGVAPAVFTFAAGPGQILRFPRVIGAWTCSYSVSEYGPDGTASGSCDSPGDAQINDPIGPFSGYHTTDFTGALVGMFLEDSLPASAPPPLRFYVADSSEGGIQTDFVALRPRIGQVFFIGDGLTGSGAGSAQVFAVPPAATHLYLGFVDSCSGTGVPGCYSDNAGALRATLLLDKPALLQGLN
jgi:hypothetical protein